MMTNTSPLRKKANLASLPKTGQLLFLGDQQHDNITISDLKISASSFIRLGMKDATFKNCSFTQSNFEDSYFRKSVFVNVDFTGSTFRFCNFDKASFRACNFRYCNFYHCKLPKDEMKACLPTEPNLRRDLATNLRSNYEMMGDKKAADSYSNIAIQADDEELKAIFLSNTEYYKSHYDQLDRVEAGFKFAFSKVSGFVWGYGRSLYRLLFSYLIVTCLLSLFTYFLKISFSVPNERLQRSLNIWESLYTGFGQTVGLSGLPFLPADLSGKIIMLSESFLGTLFLALLAATLYRRIAR